MLEIKKYAIINFNKVCGKGALLVLEKLGYIVNIGEQMLLSGAEVHRVEESINRMGYALGAKRVDVFIITSSMVVTFHLENGETYTQTRRILSANTDYEKLHRLNALSRSICSGELTAEDIKNRLTEISALKCFPVWVEVLCYAVIAGAFTLFFGGGVSEAAFSFAIGAVLRTVIYFCDKMNSNKIFSKFVSSATITLLAFALVRLKLTPSADNVIIGNIMTLIPGIGLTNALRDLFTGDSIAGLLRFIEVFLIALAIAAGYFIVVILGGMPV